MSIIKQGNIKQNEYTGVMCKNIFRGLEPVEYEVFLMTNNDRLQLACKKKTYFCFFDHRGGATYSFKSWKNKETELLEKVLLQHKDHEIC